MPPRAPETRTPIKTERGFVAAPRSACRTGLVLIRRARGCSAVPQHPGPEFTRKSATQPVANDPIMSHSNPKTAKHGKPFAAGNQYGKGRPPGSRNKMTLLRQNLLAEAPAIFRTICKQAKQGDPAAQRLFVERIYPQTREWPLNFKLPQIHTQDDLREAYNIVLEETVAGRVTTAQAERLVNVLEAGRKMLDSQELHARMGKLEEEMKDLIEPRRNHLPRPPQITLAPKETKEAKKEEENELRAA